MNWFAHQFERRRPVYGQWTVWVLCGFALILACYPFQPTVGDRQSYATIFGWLPDSILGASWLFIGTRAVLLLSAVCWALRLLVPWTCWSTVFSFTLMWSLRMENSDHAAHIFNATNMLLLIHAGWFQVESGRIRRSMKDSTFWRTDCYPEWVFTLSVFYLCWFHMWAGMTKLNHSGLGWANGLSLQLWVDMWGLRGSPSTELILSSRTLTQLLQFGALFFETTAIVGIFARPLRWWVGATLLCFYVGVLTTFVDYGFHLNAFLVLWVLLPMREWIESRKRVAERGRVDSDNKSMPGSHSTD